MAIRKGSGYKDRPTRKRTIGSRAFEHALDIELMIVDRMEELGLRKKDLAEKVGMTQSGLSNFLNGQPNMTLETMTRFEVALDAVFDISLKPAEQYEFFVGAVDEDLEGHCAPPDGDPSGAPLLQRSYRLCSGLRDGELCDDENAVGMSATISKKELCAA